MEPDVQTEDDEIIALYHEGETLTPEQQCRLEEIFEEALRENDAK